MRRFLIWLFSLSLLAGAAFAGWFAMFLVTPLGLAEAPLEVAIARGSSLRSVSEQLRQAGVSFWPWQFTLLGRLKGEAAAIKAGSYQIEAGTTPLRLLDQLTRGDVTQGEIALIEGWNFRQLRAALDRHPDLRHEAKELSDADILARIGAAERTPEGLFFPDTYLFDKNSSDVDLLRRAYRAMQRHLQQEWQAREASLPLAAPYEALILASIVEKETGLGDDRPKIAAVFLNRLRTGMLLQTDPTVIYGMGESFDGNLRKEDLVRDTAYNTYTRPGLPPTPIAMPGLESLRATLQPAASDHLYFVARGDGSSQFSSTLEEHNRAVTRYQKRKPN
jgi:UPF0755 protein